jgi:hypothetical protein
MFRRFDPKIKDSICAREIVCIYANGPSRLSSALAAGANCTTDRGVRPMSQCEAVHRSERDPDRNPGIRAVSIGVDLRVHESIAASRKES